MDRSHVLNVVIKHFRANVDLPSDFQVDPSRSMLEQGAQSLDLLEIVAASMRELKIRVPRTSLRHLKNVDELVDVFLAHCQNQAESAGPAVQSVDRPS